MILGGAPRKCVGLCELPQATVAETCRVLAMQVADVEWEYAGLNHRGFVFSLKHRGEELLPTLPDLLDKRSIFGVTAEEIRRAGALPLKYFRLSALAAAPSTNGRAQFLGELRERLTRELEQPAAPLPSLSMRDFSWYGGAVVPMIAAIFANDGRRMVVNRLAGDGLVREGPVRVWRDGVQAEAAEPPPRLASWIERWVTHERALIDAVDAPHPERIERALALDPSVPAARVRDIGQAIWAGQRS
jgi:6-phospho-beta-glucosidase